MLSRRLVFEGLRSFSLTALALAAMLAAHLSAAKSSPPKLSAQQIVARNVAARGGLEAWRKVQTMLWMGHIESVHATVPSMQFMLAQQRPNKMRFEINAMGERTVRVFDGTDGWKMRPSHGQPEVRPYSPEEVQFEQDGAGLDGLLIDYAAKGSSVEAHGIDELEKRNAYHLVVHTASGETQHVWVDAETFLEVRYDRPSPAGGGTSRTVSVVYRDYKTTDGLQIPSIIETGVGSGVTPDKMIIERVVLNPRLDAQAFSEPGASGRRDRAAVASRRSMSPTVRPLPSWLKATATPSSTSPAAPASASGSTSAATESTSGSGQDSPQ
jgi:outer membrane lipoprotein-sorting protein